MDGDVLRLEIVPHDLLIEQANPSCANTQPTVTSPSDTSPLFSPGRVAGALREQSE